MGVNEIEIPEDNLEDIHKIEITSDITDYLLCITMLVSSLIINCIIKLTLYLPSK